MPFEKIVTLFVTPKGDPKIAIEMFNVGTGR